jgi:hypothetical protein
MQELGNKVNKIYNGSNVDVLKGFEEYCRISGARVEYWKQQKESVKIPYASINNVSASKKEEQETLL